VTHEARAPISWGRATALALAILAISALCFVLIPNWVLTELTGVSHDGRVAIATVGFFTLLVIGAWMLRRLQARGVV